MSENTCVRCGEPYESYSVFITDNFADIAEREQTRREWGLHKDENDGFCKPCRMIVADYGAYLTESEREELESKEEI